MSDGGGSAAGNILQAVLGTSSSSSSMSTGNNSFSRTIGTTASVGISLIILRIVASAAQAASDDVDGANSGALLQFLRSFLHRMIVQKGRLIGDGSDDDDKDEDNVPVIHEGSCHCRSVRFELIAPQTIHCKESEAGKIQFRHARIRARSFRLLTGSNLVQMYYVNKPSGSTNTNDTGAHSFCSRCGVHFLHAPNSRSTALDVNVDCLNRDGDVKVKVRHGKKSNIAAGTPVLGQWDQDGEGNYFDGYPATIAEEASPAMVLFPPDSHTSPFAAYQHSLMARNGGRQDWDSVFDKQDDSTLPETPTPTTVYTSQTENYMSDSHSHQNNNGVPPTLTLDPRFFSNDSESVISLSSAKASFPAAGTTTTSAASSLRTSFGESLPSPQDQASNSGPSPSTTPLVRHQLNYYMRKHMSSAASSISGESSVSPSASSNNNKNKQQQKAKMISSSHEEQPEEITSN